MGPMMKHTKAMVVPYVISFVLAVLVGLLCWWIEQRRQKLVRPSPATAFLVTPTGPRVEIRDFYFMPIRCRPDPDTPYPQCSLEGAAHVRVHLGPHPNRYRQVLGECRLLDVSRPWGAPLAYRWIDVTFRPNEAVVEDEMSFDLYLPDRNYGLKRGSMLGLSCRVVEEAKPETVARIP